ncbi:MAG: tetratricopeptide repeat protein [Planctomycetota bacterium]|jgi:tetratricopeptide (TPR) repeat protein
MRALATLILFASALLPAPKARADTITLRNGNILRGRILSQDERGVKIEVAHGTIFIPITSIRTVERTRSRVELLVDAEKARKRGDTQTALSLLKRAARDPALAGRAKKAMVEIRLGRAARYIREGRVEWARRDLAELEHLAPSSPALLRAEAEFMRLKTTVDAGLDAAPDLLSENRTQEAVIALTTAATAYPSRRGRIYMEVARALCSLASSHLGNEPEKAAETFDRALSFNPAVFQNISADWARARRALAAKADAETAVTILTETLEADPVDRETRLALGAALERTGRPEDAISHYAALCPHDPPPPMASPGQWRAAAVKAAAKIHDPPPPRSSSETKGKSLTTDHFLVLFRCRDSFARDLGTSAEFHLARIGSILRPVARWPAFWTEKARLIVLSDRAAYRKSNPAAEWSDAHMYALTRDGKLVEHGVRLVAGPATSSGPIIPHEIGHLLFHALVDHGRGVPIWIHEGFALVAEPALRKPFMRRLAREAIEGEENIPFDRFLELSRYPEEDLDLFYAQAYAVTDFLVAQGRFREFLTTARRGRQDAPGQAKSLGFTDPARFEGAWREWMMGR